MVRSNERLATGLPAVLVVLTAVFLIGRQAAWNYESMHLPDNQSLIEWAEFGQTDSLPGSPHELTLYEFYADWCEPCKRIEEDVFTNRNIARMINSNFKTIRVTDRKLENGENTSEVDELKKKYHVFAYPTLVIADSAGEQLGLLVGCSSAAATYRFIARFTR